MAGSMREAIKDELQAWIGLKCKDTEEGKEVREVQEEGRMIVEGTKDGQIEEVKAEEEDTNEKGSR